MIELTINARPHQFDGDPETPLLWYLRDEMGLMAKRFGCGVASCGACGVHVDGAATQACSMTVGDLAGRSVTTIEGLGSYGLQALQEIWIELDVPQCSFCQSGQFMQAAALLAVNPDPSDGEIDEAMHGKICRCGSYPGIRAAIHEAARRLQMQASTSGCSSGRCKTATVDGEASAA
jgi:isoquinoline 1-oxidoreductase subunit alpha